MKVLKTSSQIEFISIHISGRLHGALMIGRITGKWAYSWAGLIGWELVKATVRYDHLLALLSRPSFN